MIGRFAPSPTGPLHFGSLVAALGSYLAVRSVGGKWLLRVEDLDPPRVVPGAADEILNLLDYLGFAWDGDIVWQSQRYAYYHEMLSELDRSGWLFRCSCSRREILASAPHSGEEGPVYPGTCRRGPVKPEGQSAIRIRVPDEIVAFCDGIQGGQKQNLEREVGDFVLYRADGQFAYQLAVVADDIAAGVTQVVRGADLLFSTPRQIFLYRCFGRVTPDYYHLPLALGASREKLSKRDGPKVVVTKNNGGVLMWEALKYLGQDPPLALRGAPPGDILGWGLRYFCLANIPADNMIVDFC